MRYLACFCVCLLLLTGCGYHLTGGSRQASSAKTVSVPYVIGDTAGEFTSTLIHQLVSSGAWKYAPNNEGELTLKVTLVDSRDEEIGYSYAQINNQINKWLVPNENRLSGLVKVELVETNSQNPVLEPTYLSASVRYDYDAGFNVNNFVRFSLAQYNFQEIARRTAQTPLNGELSKVIVNYLNNAW